METKTIKIKAPKVDREASFDFELPSTIEEAVALWGDEVVVSKLNKIVVIEVQGHIRTLVEGEKAPTADEVQEAASNWKPTVRKAVDKMAKLQNMLGELSAEDRAALLKTIK